MRANGCKEKLDRGWEDRKSAVMVAPAGSRKRLVWCRSEKAATVWFPGAVQRWIKLLDSAFPYSERVWHDLAKMRWQAKNHDMLSLLLLPSLEEGMSMRPPLPGEEEISKPDKGKKRKKEASTKSPRSKKSTVRRPQTDATVLTLTAAVSLRAKDEDDDDGDRSLVQRVRRSADAPQAVGRKSAKSGKADVDQTRAEETLEDGLGVVPELQVGHGTVRAGESSAVNFIGPESEIFLGREETLIEIDTGGGFESGPSFSPGEIRDAQNRGAADAGASQEEDDTFKDYFIGVTEDTDLDAPIALEEVKKLYDHAFSKLQDELSCREEELEKLTSELNESKASFARKEDELSELRASLERVHQERASFAEQIGQKNALVGRLLEEVAAKDTKILGLKRQNEAVISEKDLLWGELTSTQDLLRSDQKEAAALSVAKAEADEYASSYKRDAATANDRAREISEKAEQKLARAVAHACLQARRQAFEEASTKDVDLSAEIEKDIALEEESAPSTTSDEGSGSDSDSSEGEE
ncbi:PREDICTED: actin cytoskeleton-regulatory complex protein pan1-like [Nicotiana attenuata]|uniref:actin cytoskeleton-regulatory complex protein pan1-like n=1 Tax=Nicotiana attenuata TaxID=49451 RepID=UPI000905C377|nr:PREDICTED: actin cytoskeleton-regulatory complex protein pan1-like [Nicotiana attenuata]